jgi:hypothetical protein
LGNRAPIPASACIEEVLRGQAFGALFDINAGIFPNAKPNRLRCANSWH